jgi:hypothetical protein
MSEALRRHKRVFNALDRWRIALALIVVALHAEQLGFLPVQPSQGGRFVDSERPPRIDRLNCPLVVNLIDKFGPLCC